MNESCDPDEEKRPYFEVRAVISRKCRVPWQETVDGEKGAGRHHDSGRRADRQSPANVDLDRFGAVCGDARPHPEEAARGDHDAAGKPAKEVKPAQRPVVELNEVHPRQSRKRPFDRRR